MWAFVKKRRKYLLATLVVLVIAYYLCLPRILFHDSYSTVLDDSRGQLLSASISADGQWRFPESDSVSEKFAVALVAFEDKRFWGHPGFDFLSLGRALRENIEAGHQTENQPDSADVPTGARFQFRPEEGLKNALLIQTVPGRNGKERRGGPKETRGQCDPAMQFVHPSNPSRKTPHPEQEREERS